MLAPRHNPFKLKKWREWRGRQGKQWNNHDYWY